MSELTGIAFLGNNLCPESCGRPLGCFQYRVRYYSYYRYFISISITTIIVKKITVIIKLQKNINKNANISY